MQQRLALGIILLAALWWLIPIGHFIRVATIAGRMFFALCVAFLLSFTILSNSGDARALGDRATRAGFRVLALNNHVGALAFFEKAMEIDPSNRAVRPEIARVRLNMAEAEVVGGLADEAYARAAEHLEFSLAAQPTEPAVALSEAVAAVRHANIIWNDYVWPLTVADLRRGYRLRPDLTGLSDKLYAANISAALSALESGDLGSAEGYVIEASMLRSDGRELPDLRARMAKAHR